MKTYIITALMFFVPLCLLAWLNMLDIPHLTMAAVILAPLFVVGRVLWYLGSRLKHKLP
jgi:hypothetical protein